MKKLIILFVVLSALLTGCNTAKQSLQAEKDNFKFCSLQWGADWETLKKSDVLKNADILKEDGNRKTVKLESGKYLETPIGDVGLVFDTNGISDTAGLVSVSVQYKEENEQALLTQLEKIYGKRKSTYTDKNGYKNPIDPAGWVSSETIEGVFTEEEKEYYISMFPKNYEQTRIDALLRSPLVIIRFDEELNVIVFNGNDAAIVSYIQAELKK